MLYDELAESDRAVLAQHFAPIWDDEARALTLALLLAAPGLSPGGIEQLRAPQLKESWTPAEAPRAWCLANLGADIALVRLRPDLLALDHHHGIVQWPTYAHLPAELSTAIPGALQIVLSDGRLLDLDVSPAEASPESPGSEPAP